MSIRNLWKKESIKKGLLNPQRWDWSCNSFKFANWNIFGVGGKHRTWQLIFEKSEEMNLLKRCYAVVFAGYNRQESEMKPLSDVMKTTFKKWQRKAKVWNECLKNALIFITKGPKEKTM